MGRSHGETVTAGLATSTEDLGEDVVALAAAAETRGRASVVRRVNGLLVRVIVEVA